MGRPTTKDELLDAARAEFARLWAAVAMVPQADRERPGACEGWSVKDLLAHLDAWHELLLGWQAAGAAGQRPEIPGPGYTWAMTPALNATIQARCAQDPWADVADRLRASHARVLEVIDSCAPEDLFAKKRYAWTGTTSVGSYAVSATSSHYAWAGKLIRTWARSCASPPD
ncbi:MAG: ClbS/DfsB family four-helix bundle protein [Candidatus Nanopelagicales bacterium]